MKEIASCPHAPQLSLANHPKNPLFRVRPSRLVLRAVGSRHTNALPRQRLTVELQELRRNHRHRLTKLVASHPLFRVHLLHLHSRFRRRTCNRLACHLIQLNHSSLSLPDLLCPRHTHRLRRVVRLHGEFKTFFILQLVSRHTG